MHSGFKNIKITLRQIVRSRAVNKNRVERLYAAHKFKNLVKICRLAVVLHVFAPVAQVKACLAHNHAVNVRNCHYADFNALRKQIFLLVADLIHECAADVSYTESKNFYSLRRVEAETVCNAHCRIAVFSIYNN